jgi:hypothetical protein
MLKGKTGIIVLVTLVIGFTAGFILRPVVMPAANMTVAVGPPLAPVAAVQSRGTGYFEANIDEARRVVAACREGTVRGDECANAETALITVESKERFRRFRKDR